MIPWITAHPVVTTLILWLVALCVAWLINWGIVTQAYFPRAIGVWNKVPDGAPQRSWLDWLPIVGWWRLRRETKFHGPAFWLRPFLIELLFPLTIVWLYHWEISGNTLPSLRQAAQLQAELHGQFVGHFLLMTFMMVATFIDFDEHLIPDTITLPGTIVGLVGSAVATAWFPFDMATVELHANSVGIWPAWLDGSWGLGIALMIISLYSFGLLDRVWITRRGIKKAVRYFFAMMFRSRWWMIVLGLWIVLALTTTWAWWAGIGRWQYLLSAYFGLAGAAGYTWLIRLAAKHGLGVEALGFGDVTLMAMIGVYVGWQPSVLVFFLAPCFGVAVFLGRMLLTGSHAGAYGPFLCMAAATIIVFWDYFHREYMLEILELPAGITWGILLSTLLMLWGVLKVYHYLFGRVRGIR